MAIIIIEGFDRVGKSTLASKFKGFCWSVVHTGKPKGACEEVQAFYESRYEFCSRGNTVFDRFVMSELVYQYVYTETRVEQKWAEDFIRRMKEDGVVYLWLQEDIDVVRSRWSSDEMYEWSEDAFWACYEGYTVMQAFWDKGCPEGGLAYFWQ